MVIAILGNSDFQKPVVFALVLIVKLDMRYLGFVGLQNIGLKFNVGRWKIWGLVLMLTYLWYLSHLSKWGQYRVKIRYINVQNIWRWRCWTYFLVYLLSVTRVAITFFWKSLTLCNQVHDEARTYVTFTPKKCSWRTHVVMMPLHSWQWERVCFARHSPCSGVCTRNRLQTATPPAGGSSLHGSCMAYHCCASWFMWCKEFALSDSMSGQMLKHGGENLRNLTNFCWFLCVVFLVVIVKVSLYWFYAS